jgi:mevalonate pyrophosphate decarboxylase
MRDVGDIHTAQAASLARSYVNCGAIKCHGFLDTRRRISNANATGFAAADIQNPVV